jgi:tetratricopeptide (TPR) repeat protein
MSDDEILESIIKGLKFEDIVGLREYLKEKIAEHGWKAIWGKMTNAIKSEFGGFQSSRWFRVQYTLLDTFEIPFLAGYDGSIQDVFEEIEETTNFDLVQQLLETKLIALLESQFTTGSTLFLRTREMENSGSSVLIPIIAEARKRELQSIVVHEKNGRYDLTQLWKTGYGFEICSSLMAPLEADKELFKKIEKSVSDLGIRIKTSGQGVEPKLSNSLTDLVMNIPRICQRSINDSKEPLMEAIRNGHPIPSSVIVEAIGSINNYQHQADRMTTSMNPFMRENYINPDTMFTYEEVFGDSDVLLSSLGRLHSSDNVKALIDYLNDEIENPMNLGYHYEVVRALERYNSIDVVQPLRRLFSNIKAWEFKGPMGLRRNVLVSQDSGTISKAAKIIAKYDTSGLMDELIELLNYLGHGVAGFYYIGVEAAAALIDIFGIAGVKSVLPWAFIEAPEDPGSWFAPEGEQLVLKVLQNNRPILVEALVDIISSGNDDETYRAMQILESLESENTDDDQMIQLDPNRLASIISDTNHPLHFLSVISKLGDFTSSLVFSEAILNRAEDFAKDLSSMNNPTDMAYLLPQHPALFQNEFIRDVIADLFTKEETAIHSINIFLESKEKLGESLLTLIGDNLVETIKNAKNPGQFAISYEQLSKWEFVQDVADALAGRAKDIGMAVINGSISHYYTPTLEKVPGLTAAEEFHSVIANNISNVEDRQLRDVLTGLSEIEAVRQSEIINDSFLKMIDQFVGLVEKGGTASYDHPVNAVCGFPKIAMHPRIKNAMEKLIVKSKGLRGVMSLGRTDLIRIVKEVPYLLENEMVVETIAKALSVPNPDASIILEVEKYGLHEVNDKIKSALVQAHKNMLNDNVATHYSLRVFAGSSMINEVVTDEEKDERVAHIIGVIDNLNTLYNNLSQYPDALIMPKTNDEFSKFMNGLSWIEISKWMSNQHDTQCQFALTLINWAKQAKESFRKELGESGSPHVILRMTKYVPELLDKLSLDIVGGLIKRNVQASPLLEILLETKHSEDDVILEAIAENLSSTGSWEILSILQRNDNLLAYEGISLALESRIPDIQKIILSSDKEMWPVKALNQNAIIVENEDVAKTVAKAIKDKHRIWDILDSLQGSPILESKEVQSAIGSTRDYIHSELSSSNQNIRYLSLVQKIPGLSDSNVLSESLVAQIKKSAYPLEALKDIPIPKSDAQRKSIEKALLEKIDLIASEISHSPTPFTTISPLENYPKMLENQKVEQAIASSVRSNPDVQLVLTGILSSKVKNLQSVQEAIASKLQDPVSIVVASEIIAEDDILTRDGPLTKALSNYYNSAKSGDAVVIQKGFGTFRFDRQIIEFLGGFLQNKEVQKAIASYGARFESGNIEKLLKALKENIRDSQDFEEIIVNILKSSMKFTTTLAKVVDYPSIMKSSSVHKVIEARISKRTDALDAIPIILRTKELMAIQSLQLAVLDSIETVPNPLEVLKAMKGTSALDEENVKKTLKRNITRIADSISSTSEPGEVLEMLKDIDFIMQEKRIIKTFVGRSRDLSIFVRRAKKPYNAIKTLTSIPNLLDEKPVFDSVLESLSKSDRPLDIVELLSDNKAFMKHEITHKAIAQYVRDSMNPETITERIKKCPELYAASDIMSAIESRKDSDSPDSLIERAERLLRKGEFNQSIRALEKAKELEPTKAKVWFALARGLHTRGGRLVETGPGMFTSNASDLPNAEEYYKKAIEMDSRNPEFWEGLSIFYRDTGRPALAEQTRKDAEKRLRS